MVYNPDVILISGDAVIDSPYVGVAIIARFLQHHGFSVEIISQPDVNSERDITRYGEPRLFWGISAGCTDSMVANTTPLLKRRRQDDFTPGGENNKRPDRATIVYSQLIRRYFKQTKPIILGGIEASLRRLSHYDFWTDSVKKAVILDAKADAIVYGQGEHTALAIAERLQEGKDFSDLPGLVVLKNNKESLPADYLWLPSHEEVMGKDDAAKLKFIELFHRFYENTDHLNAKGLIQPVMNRFVVQNPPAPHLSSKELDVIYELPYTYNLYDTSEKREVRAMETIKSSITTHRGCYGECNFCAIAVHQGRRVVSRGLESIEREAVRLTKHPSFKGYIFDVGGATANMYDIECDKKIKSGACKKKRCLSTHPCSQLKMNHEPQMKLLDRLRAIPGVKKVFVASGIRFDMVFKDQQFGRPYLRSVIQNHLSGQMKVAPEHTNAQVLKAMGKCDASYFNDFEKEFYRINKETGKKQLLSYYFIAAHPGCGEEEMEELKKANQGRIGLKDQVQIFTPTPGTYSSLMYYTERDPYTLQRIKVEKGLKGKRLQKEMLYGGD